MDGVIADFNKRYVSLFGINPREAEKNKKFDTYFEQFIESGQFSTLDVMPGAMQGVDYLRKFPAPTQILSSTASEKSRKLLLEKLNSVTTGTNSNECSTASFLTCTTSEPNSYS
jgi:hypothetical protein